MSRPIYVTDPTSIPTQEHWAIIESTSVYIPGDERSRTAPGHGYPERTEKYISYTAYLDYAEFEKELTYRLGLVFSGKSVRGIHVVGVYDSKTVIELSEKK